MNMPPSNWDEIEEVFQAALDVPAGERPAWVAARCGADAGLRREVESLLAAEADSENFLRRPDFVRAVGSLLGGDGQADRAGQQLGAFRILREIGRGGMGVVYEAAREDGEFRQRVAVKVVKRGLDTDDILRRFRHERQILASLHHPNIATVFDGGTTPDGLPYFVMEYVEGLPLLQYCDEHGLSTGERLRLFRKVCAAVEHAHQNLVVHRDLKPSNILVTEEGGVKLLDFGVAKLLDPGAADAGLTETQAPRVMTPEYASPEQVRGLRVTTATDVYSLGVVLYELLTGARPYSVKDASPEEVSRAICYSQPSKPSEALRDGRLREGAESVSSSETTSRTRERVSRSQLKGDVDNIILKALRKEPERRYGSVGQFSEDIGRHLKGLPVVARSDTFAYRAAKFAGRNRVAVSAAALVAAAIIAGLIVALWQADAARRQRDLAQRERVKAERINAFLQRMLSFSNQSVTSVSPVAQRSDVTVNEMLDEITPQVEAELADQPEVRAQVLRTIGSAYASQGQYDAAEKNLRSALDAQTRLYGEESAEAAATMVELGVLSYRQSKLDEANRLLEKAVVFYRKQRQANAPDYSAAKLALASDYLGVVKLYYQGDTKASLALMNEALQISSGAHLQGGERGVLIFNKADLGALLVTLGEVEKGEPLLREAEAEYRQTSSQPRWELGVTLMHLGVAALSKNQPDEAQKYLLESEQILRHTLGDKNVYLSSNLVVQANAFFQKHELPAAEARVRAALAVCQAFSPDNRLPWAAPLWTLGDILTKAGRVRESEDYYRQALAIHEAQATKNYRIIAPLKIRLSQSLLTQNRLPEAERVALEARGDVTRDLGAQHPLLQAATDLLAKIYEQQGRHDPAQGSR